MSDRHTRLAINRARTWLVLAERSMEPEKRSRLVEDWRESWRWASMRFNAIAAVVVGLALNNIDVLVSVLSMAPPVARPFVAVGVGVALFVIVAGLRLWKQNRK